MKKASMHVKNTQSLTRTHVQVGVCAHVVMYASMNTHHFQHTLGIPFQFSQFYLTAMFLLAA